MNNTAIADKDILYTRISKKTALNMYCKGESIALCPCNLRPGAPWYPDVILNRSNRKEYTTDEESVRNDFNNLIASFEFYNLNPDSGSRVYYYLVEKRK